MKGPKAETVETMFDSIAPDYDKLNHILSLNVDRRWRRRAIPFITDNNRALEILDVACGTGDFSIDIALHSSASTRIMGLDLSDGMLEVMKQKLGKLGLCGRVSTCKGNCEALPFPDNSFDSVSIGFGIRNFENREAALKEILRVLKPGGHLVILELSIPSIPVVRGLYKFYFLNILPLVGGGISGDKAAYRYLPASVIKFPSKTEWMATMSGCGFRNVTHKALSLGICRMYVAEK